MEVCHSTPDSTIYFRVVLLLLDLRNSKPYEILAIAFKQYINNITRKIKDQNFMFQEQTEIYDMSKILTP